MTAEDVLGRINLLTRDLLSFGSFRRNQKEHSLKEVSLGYIVDKRCRIKGLYSEHSNGVLEISFYFLTLKVEV